MGILTAFLAINLLADFLAATFYMNILSTIVLLSSDHTVRETSRMVGSEGIKGRHALTERRKESLRNFFARIFTTRRKEERGMRSAQYFRVSGVEHNMGEFVTRFVLVSNDGGGGS